MVMWRSPLYRSSLQKVLTALCRLASFSGLWYLPLSACVVCELLEDVPECPWSVAVL